MFLPKIKHGKFQWPGKQGEPKRYAIIPFEVHKGEAIKATPAIEEIFKLWNLAQPNLLLQIDSNQSSFGDFFRKGGGQALLQADDFEFARMGANGAPNGQGPTVAAAAGADDVAVATDDAAIARATEVLDLKLHLFCDAVVTAAEQTQSWLVSSRDAPGMNFIDLVLDEVLAKGGSHPTVLVTDYLNRSEYKLIYPWLHQVLVDGAVPGDSMVKETVVLPDIWNLQGKFWQARAADTGQSAPLKDLAMKFSKLAENPTSIAESFGKMRSLASSTEITDFFPSICGSHYLFFEAAEGSMAGEIGDPLFADKFSTIGDIGYVFMGGGAKLAAHILDCYSKGVPSVLVKNCGGASHRAALIHELVSKEKYRERANTLLAQKGGATPLPVLQEEFDKALRKQDHHIANGIFTAANLLYGNKCFTFPEILSIVNHYRARPPLFSKTIRVVNPMKDTPAQLLNVLSGALGSTYTGALELGGADAAETIVVAAWGKHCELDETSRKQGRRASALMAIITLCNLCTTILAVTIAYVKQSEDLVARLQDGPCWRVMKLSIVILPALSGFFMTISSRFQYQRKWGVFRFACAQIVAEAYKFRMRVGPYSTSSRGAPPAGNDLASKQAVPLSKPAISRRARQNFTQAIDDILSSAEKAGLSDEARDTAPAPTSLPRHIDRCVLPSRYLPRTAEPSNLASAEEASSYVVLGAEPIFSGDVEADDYVQAISADTYLECRVKPLIRYYRELSPKLARQNLQFEVLVLLAATAGTLLSALDYSEWVPISVAFGTSIAALTHFAGTSARLAAVNNTLRELESIEMEASGLGVVDHSMPSFKTMIVERCETAVLAEASAYTQAVGSMRSAARRKDGGDETGEATEKGEAKKDKKQ